MSCNASCKTPFFFYNVNVQNLVASFKHRSRNKRYIYNIFTLKANNGYSYIQDNCFLGQETGKNVFLFMCMHGDGSGCDLVKWMQLGGDLQTAWIMFDHVNMLRVG
jgi:hypothetical protein